VSADPPSASSESSNKTLTTNPRTSNPLPHPSSTPPTATSDGNFSTRECSRKRPTASQHSASVVACPTSSSRTTAFYLPTSEPNEDRPRTDRADDAARSPRPPSPSRRRLFEPSRLTSRDRSFLDRLRSSSHQRPSGSLPTPVRRRRVPFSSPLTKVPGTFSLRCFGRELRLQRTIQSPEIQSLLIRYCEAEMIRASKLPSIRSISENGTCPDWYLSHKPFNHPSS
jgi:hypothetical protein